MRSILEMRIGGIELVTAEINDWLNSWSGTPEFTMRFGFFCIECIST